MNEPHKARESIPNSNLIKRDTKKYIEQDLVSY